MAYATPARQQLAEGIAVNVASTALKVLAAAPADRLRYLLQCQRELPVLQRTALLRGAIDAVKRVTFEQGVRAWWRGGSMAFVMHFPNAFLNPILKSAADQVFRVDVKHGYWPAFVGHLAAGSAAGIGTLAVSYPVFVGRLRLALDMGGARTDAVMTQGAGAKAATTRREWRSGAGVVRALSTRVGWFRRGGVYSGFGAAATALVSYRVLHVTLYDAAVDALANSTRVQPHELSGDMRFGAAFCASLAAGLATYPLSTASNRMIASAGMAAPKYADMSAALRTIYRAEGLPGLYGGALVQVVTGVASAAALVALDGLREALFPRRRTAAPADAAATTKPAPAPASAAVAAAPPAAGVGTGAVDATKS